MWIGPTMVYLNGAFEATTRAGTPSTQGITGSPSIAVSSEAGVLVVDNLVSRCSGTVTVGADQAECWNLATTTVRAAGSTEPGAASVTMSRTASDETAIIGVNIKQ